MRWIALLGFMSCAELPLLPQVDAGAEWTCDVKFDEAIEECIAEQCPGFMAVNGRLDAETVRFVSSSVYVLAKFGDADSIETLELHSTTDYFRSVITIGSLGLQADETAGMYRVLSRDLADVEHQAVTFRWDASNSEIPQTNIGVRGLTNIQIVDDWIRITFLVTDQSDHILQGCAYIPID